MAESVALARQGSWSLADDAQSTDQDPFLVDLNTEFDTIRDLFCQGLDSENIIQRVGFTGERSRKRRRSKWMSSSNPSENTPRHCSEK